MGVWTTLEIYQADNIKFDDLSKLNTDLESLGLGTFAELYGEYGIGDVNWQGVFRFRNKLEIANRCNDGFDGYGDMTQIWGCTSPKNWQTIADHMTDGKLVFFQDCEEPSYAEYIVIEPSKYERLSAKKFRPKF